MNSKIFDSIVYVARKKKIATKKRTTTPIDRAHCEKTERAIKENVNVVVLDQHLWTTANAHYISMIVNWKFWTNIFMNFCIWNTLCLHPFCCSFCQENVRDHCRAMNWISRLQKALKYPFQFTVQWILHHRWLGFPRFRHSYKSLLP